MGEGAGNLRNGYGFVSLFLRRHYALGQRCNGVALILANVLISITKASEIAHRHPTLLATMKKMVSASSLDETDRNVRVVCGDPARLANAPIVACASLLLANTVKALVSLANGAVAIAVF